MRIVKSTSEPEGELPGRRHDLRCGDCGKPMQLHKSSKKFGNGEFRHYYRCEDWPTCKGAIGSHPDGSPLGVPANQETRDWRIKAHTVFNKLYEGKDALFTKSQAYAWLRLRMELTQDEAHIACFDIEQCERLILLATIWLEMRAYRLMFPEFVNRFEDMSKEEREELAEIAHGKTGGRRTIATKMSDFFKRPRSGEIPHIPLMGDDDLPF